SYMTVKQNKDVLQTPIPTTFDEVRVVISPEDQNFECKDFCTQNSFDSDDDLLNTPLEYLPDTPSKTQKDTLEILKELVEEKKIRDEEIRRNQIIDEKIRQYEEERKKNPN